MQENRTFEDLRNRSSWQAAISLLGLACTLGVSGAVWRFYQHRAATAPFPDLELEFIVEFGLCIGFAIVCISEFVRNMRLLTHYDTRQKTHEGMMLSGVIRIENRRLDE
jgi:hypothetical protein